MNTSQEMSLKSAICCDDTRLPPWQLGYFKAAAQDDAHAAVMKLFLELAQADGLTRAFMARRLGKKPEQITRWLAAPGNWTLETLSNLLLALGHRPTFGAEPLNSLRESNFRNPAATSGSNNSVEVEVYNPSLKIDSLETSNGGVTHQKNTKFAPRRKAEHLPIANFDKNERQVLFGKTSMYGRKEKSSEHVFPHSSSFLKYEIVR